MYPIVVKARMDFPVAEASAILNGDIHTDAVVGQDAFLPPPIAPSSIISVPEDELTNYDLEQLAKEGYSSGLIRSMTELKKTVAKQIWIVDDSGSMIMNDGNVLASTPSQQKGDGFRFVKCSRWDELQECVRAHIRLSGALRFPTSFHLLNGLNSFGVCEISSSNPHLDVEHGLNIISTHQPSGPTPLKRHVQRIQREVEAMLPSLLRSRKRVIVCIATDGLPSDVSDENFISELRALESLPVWIVIRLCTNDANIVHFYNNLDAELEVPVDVIDDFLGEALEIAQVNPWLNYALPLHHVREMGLNERVFDLIDERPLTGREQKEVCTIIFGEEKMVECPDPGVNWKAFLGYMDNLLEREQLQWDPIRGKLQPWVDFRKSKMRTKLQKARNLKKELTGSGGCFGSNGCLGWL